MFWPATCTSLQTEDTCAEMRFRFVSGDMYSLHRELSGDMYSLHSELSGRFKVPYFTPFVISFYHLTTHFNESYLIFKLWSDLDTFN